MKVADSWSINVDVESIDITRDGRYGGPVDHYVRRMPVSRHITATHDDGRTRRHWCPPSNLTDRGEVIAWCETHDPDNVEVR